MNINAYDLDSLRSLVRQLQAENKTLRDLLAEKQIPVDESDVFQTEITPDEYDPDQASRIIPFEITLDVARRFYQLFWGRMDFYARRGKNGGYFPQCKKSFSSLCPRKEPRNQGILPDLIKYTRALDQSSLS